MAEERAERRLAAILAADVAGYSRLMEKDEERTHAAFLLCRAAIAEIVADHRGRIFGGAGDSVMAEFASPVEAVRAGVEIQMRVAGQALDLPAGLQMQFRIGINLGDVMVDRGELFGDGVNVAARLQAMAEPGGICLSGSVHDQVGNKLPLAFDDLGPCEVKNIAKPVRAFHVRLQHQEPNPSTASQSGRAKPSIAVLPFTNMSGDPEQQYFSDGITEDIITELSRFRSLFVIARNSSFQYRDKAVDVRRIARELGVQYVVEGSLRRSGDHLRMTAQLIEAGKGNHVWSERYDRSLADVFTVQDEVVRAIVAQIASHLTIFESEKARRRRTDHLGAYDCYLRGLDHWRAAGPEPTAESSVWFEKSLELDPDYADPLTRLCTNEAIAADSPEAFERVLAMANRAVALDPNNSWSHCALGVARLVSGSVAASESHFETAMRLNPNDPDLIKWCSLYHLYSGNFGVAHDMVMAAERLNPLPPPWYQNGKAAVEYGLHRYAAAAQLLEGLGSATFYWDHCYLAACYARLGKVPQAKMEIAKALRLKPNLTIRGLTTAEPYTRPADMKHFLEPLRKAGLPE